MSYKIERKNIRNVKHRAPDNGWDIYDFTVYSTANSHRNMILRFHEEKGIQVIDCLSGVDLVTPSQSFSVEPLMDDEDALELYSLLQIIVNEREKKQFQERIDSIKAFMQHL